MAITYRSEWVKCGKAGCGTCPHGPYWYGYWKEGGKLHKKYIGKELPKEGPGPKKEEKKPHPWDGIMNDATASVALACEIIGISTRATHAEAKAAYRALAAKVHPDRGGDHWTSCRVNAAWGYLRSMKGWA